MFQMNLDMFKFPESFCDLGKKKKSLDLFVFYVKKWKECHLQ